MTNQNTPRTVDTDVETQYWRGQYDKEGYYEAGRDYDQYDGAYRTGYEGYGKYRGKSFDQAEAELQADWERAKGKSQLAWDKAKHAVKAAWHRVERALPGDADRDGR